MTDVDIAQIQKGFREIQDKICNFLVEATGQNYLEDAWSYQKGEGGGISRVWEGDQKKAVLEKGGVNYSGIVGQNLPTAAATQLKAPANVPYHATGVSLVIHPSNPHVPTIHMNVRYFQAGDVWWFGGGIDVTPYYPRFTDVKGFHQKLKEICERNNQSYANFKKECDEYFYLKHRDETRGIGGIFFDHLTTGDKYPQSKLELWNFVKDLGTCFAELYRPFITKERQALVYSPAQREYQLLRRGRYVEFNLVYDRGTKFGLQSEGRTESILMSLPTYAEWKYNWKPAEGTREARVNSFYLKAQDWLNIEFSAKELEEEIKSQFVSGSPQFVSPGRQISDPNTWLLAVLGASIALNVFIYFHKK